MTPPLILVVDDKEENRYLLRTLLEGAGYTVAEAAHGGEALDLARRKPPSLVVADILMPVMDGFALCRQWREDESLRSIPFVFYTATYTDGRDRDFALSLGADDFLVKPQEPEALVACLQDVLRRSERPVVAPQGKPEQVFLRQYNETLIRKLEIKMEQLEQDIVERRKAEASLRESENRFRELFDNMTSGVAVYEAIRDGEDFTFKDVNQAGLAMGALKRPDVVGKPVTEVYPGIREMGLLDILRRVWKTGKSESLPARHYRDERLSHWYENHVYQLPSGEIVAIYDNVTERVAALGALRDSEERFRSFVENANDIVFSLSQDGRVTYVSPNWTEWLGHAPGEVRDHFFGDFVHPDDLRACLSAMEGAKAGIKQAGIEYRVRHKNGHWCWHMTNGVFLPGSGERSASFLGIARDVTDRKQVDEDRDRLQTQLNQMQKIESLGRLAGGVAHDFNNMLGAILGHAELALEDLSPEHPLHGHLLEIRKAADRSAALTRQLLAFARKQTVAPKVLDLNETIAGMLQMLRRLIGENIELAWHPGPDLGPVKIDPSQIDQILANLCVNARDAISGVGTLAIETARATFDDSGDARHAGHLPGEYVLIAVSDTGCGMDKETLGKLFEPFFTTKEVGQGTGLGLSTIYGIVKQNRGFIDVYSEPGLGSTFKIYLPRYENQPAPSAANETKANAAGNGETILLVEDEPSILAIAQALLENLGYRVLGVSTPGEAIQLAQTHPGDIHLLMTDVVMPEMNGRDLAQQLVALRPSLKRLFMSGYTADVIAHHGILADGIHFIQKPFTLTELAAQIRETLNS